jgi:branched-chain amino acid aminotransferase
VQNQAVVDRTIWLDGQFVPWKDATVHVLSHSLQRGSLVFD